MVRRVAPTGEALVRCRNCSGYARRRVRPKLMNHCRPLQKGTKRAWGNVANDPAITRRRGSGQGGPRVDN